MSGYENQANVIVKGFYAISNGPVCGTDLP